MVRGNDNVIQSLAGQKLDKPPDQMPEAAAAGTVAGPQRRLHAPRHHGPLLELARSAQLWLERERRTFRYELVQ
jgi:hypothetical protein